MKARRDIFQAIADPTRRAMIFLLAGGALTPNALSQHFESSRQAVSKHLQILTACEIVRAENRGREVYYHLHPERIREVEDWLSQFKELMAQRFDQLDEVLETLKRNRA
jgi:DNA-binding transcriptional ArsR family regulator